MQVPAPAGGPLNVAVPQQGVPVRGQPAAVALKKLPDEYTVPLEVGAQMIPALPLLVTAARQLLLVEAHWEVLVQVWQFAKFPLPLAALAAVGTINDETKGKAIIVPRPTFLITSRRFNSVSGDW